MNSSSSRVKTLPVGLFGLQMMMAFGALVEGGAQFVAVERPVGRAQGDVARARVGEDGVGRVVLVERLEDDDLVAGVDRRHHRRDHAFGRAAGDGQFRLGVNVETEIPLRLLGNRLAEIRAPPRDRVLVHVRVDGAHRRRLISAGAGKSGKPCERFTAPCLMASRVISRMTDSVKRDAFSETWRRTACGGLAVVGAAGVRCHFLEN
jgi:hypothetical protein